MRKVVIATPTYTGEVNMKYTCALLKTVQLAMIRGIDIQVCYTAGDALVQKARITSLLLQLIMEQMISFS
jgi:hypothetical protein